jgi:hypothetical protein
MSNRFSFLLSTTDSFFSSFLLPFLISFHVISFQPLPRSIRNRNAKFDKNITKRGLVSPGKVAEVKEYPVSKTLIVFFLIVVVGSSLVQVLNMFKSPPPIATEE